MVVIKKILKFFKAWTAKKELRKYGVSGFFRCFSDKNRLNLDVLLSHRVSYVLRELKIREDLRRLKIQEVPKAGTIRSYLSKLDEDKLWT